MLKLGIIGYGYWGPNLVRNFSAINNCEIHTICDSNLDKIKLLSKNYPSVILTNNPDDILTNSEIDAIVIATPVNTHFKFAKKGLENGKHILVEKPICETVEEATELINIAKNYHKILMVDHTFLYTGAVQKIKEIISKGELGKLKYFDSTRINLGIFQSDVNVLWDLAPHDLSILLYLINEKPKSVNATGVSHTTNNIENIAYLTINFESDFIAHINCSWSSPVKLRTTLIGGDKKMIVYNDMEPTEKVKIYDFGYNVSSDEEKQKILVDYRTGDIFTPKLKSTEALHFVASDFINCILENKQPISDAAMGLEVVKILEAAQISIKSNGKEVILN